MSCHDSVDAGAVQLQTHFWKLDESSLNFPNLTRCVRAGFNLVLYSITPPIMNGRRDLILQIDKDGNETSQQPRLKLPFAVPKVDEIGR